MIRRPPRSTQSRSSAASDVYKRQVCWGPPTVPRPRSLFFCLFLVLDRHGLGAAAAAACCCCCPQHPVSYTHLRAHETREDLVCRLLLEKKKERDRGTVGGPQQTGRCKETGLRLGRVWETAETRPCHLASAARRPRRGPACKALPTEGYRCAQASRRKEA